MSDFVKISQQNLILEEKIGEGGYSTVYRMRWRTCKGNIKVAAKHIKRVELEELNIMVKLKHPHVVDLLGFVDEGIDFLLILELCEEGSLRSYLDRQSNALSSFRFIDWAEQMAKPIEYLQSIGIVHKDIKAANYLIAKQRILKLADFGLSKCVDKTKPNTTGRGTYGWMAPELLADCLLSPTFDIYAYGVTLWELVTTEVPYHGLEGLAIVYQVCHNKRRPPIPADCREDLAELMKQCWHEDRERRPSIKCILDVLKKAKQQIFRQQRSHSESDQDDTHHKKNSSARAFKAPSSRRYRPSTGVLAIETKFGQRGRGRLRYACGIAYNNISGDIIVADRDSAQANVYSMNGEIKCHLSTKRELKPGEKSRPYGVATSSDGTKYFVTDGTSLVKVFNNEGAYKTHFATTCVKSPTSVKTYLDLPQLGGLAVDAKGHLLVGVVNKKYISIHTTDGTHSNRGCIKVPIEPWNLAVTPNNTIIVSSYQSRRVQIVDRTGTLVASVDPPASVSNWLPYGVCCTPDGLVYVCNWATDKNKGVHCFCRANYLRRAPTDSYSPKDVALADNGGKLLVSGGADGVSIYLRR